jgi:hypothetical protein
MLAVTSEKLREREQTCVEHFRQAAERGGSFAEYFRTNGLRANDWHAVRHGMVLKGLVPPAKQSAVKRTRATKGKRLTELSCASSCGSFILDLLGGCDGKIARDASPKATYQK